MLIATQTVKDRKTRRYKFTHEKLKIGIRKPFSRRPRWMGGIDDGVSHFLCPDHSCWLPSQRCEVTLAEKRQARREIADEWREGLANGTYENRADIARKHGCSRAWVTRLLKRELSAADA